MTYETFGPLRARKPTLGRAPAGRPHELAEIDTTAQPRFVPQHNSLTSDATQFEPAPSTPESISKVQSEPELARRLLSASLWSFVIYVGGAGLTFLAQLVIARKIGAPSYGIYSYVMAWTTLLSYMAALGFNIALLRFLAAYSATGNGRWRAE